MPLGSLPPEGSPHYTLMYLVWPIVTFLVITSILVHGSSVAVFTLGKRINTLTITMSYTAAPEDGPSWMNRLPRISSQSRSQARTMSETSLEDLNKPEFPPGTLAPPTHFLRRQREEEASRPGSRASSLVSRKRKHKKWDDGIGPGGPVSQSAIFPQRNSSSAPMSPMSPRESTSAPMSPMETNSAPMSPMLDEKQRSPSPRENTDSTLADEGSRDKDIEKNEDLDESPKPSPEEGRQHVEIYEEGDDMIFENEDGDVLDVQSSPQPPKEGLPLPVTASGKQADKGESGWTLGGIRKRVNDMYASEVEKRKDHKDKAERRHEPARAYQFGNTVSGPDSLCSIVKTNVVLDYRRGRRWRGCQDLRTSYSKGRPPGRQWCSQVHGFERPSSTCCC